MQTPISEAEAAKIIKAELIIATERIWEQLVTIVGSDNEAWLEDHFQDFILNGLMDFTNHMEQS